MSQRDDQNIVEKAVALSLIEVVLGSFLHAFKIPFTGHFLSLNQGLFLTRSLDQKLSRFQNAKAVVEISMVVAIMKSLSPAGRKLGPMISIGMQGFLYMFGIFIFGKNLIAQMLAMILLSLWAFVQPLVTYALMYGPDFTKALEYLISKLEKHIPISITVIVIFIGTKLFIAMSIPFINRYFSRFVDSYQLKLKNLTPKKVSRVYEPNPIKGTLKDMTKPFFLLSVVLMILFFALTGSSTAIIFWKTLRALAIAFIIFFLSRSKMFKSILLKISHQNSYLKRLFTLSQNAYQKLIS